MSLFKSASTVSLWTLASRITGLGRELLIASWFGASALTDAFNVAFRIPNLFRRLFAEGAFSQAFVPVLATSRQQAGDEATQVLIDQVTTVLAWALFVASVAGVLGAPWLVWVMASGLQQSPEGFDAAVVMTRWMFPYIALMSLVALGAGAALAGLVSAVPQLVWLSEHKETVFAAAALMLTTAGYMQWRARSLPCPADPALAAACLRTRKTSLRVYVASVAIFATGGFFAFIAPLLG